MTRTTLGQLLHAWRKKAKLSQREAALALDVDESDWSRYENDKLVPSAKTLHKLVLRSKGALTADKVLAAAARGAGR